MWDETFYMGTGIYTWDSQTFKLYENSPLYSYIFRIAHIFISRPEDLIQAVSLMGAAGSLLALFACSYAIGRNMLMAVACTALLICCNFGMVMPRLIYPAIIFLAVGAAIAYNLRTPAPKLALLALATLMATFIRPEFALAFYIYLALTILTLAYTAITSQKRQALRQSWADSITLGLSLVAIFLIAKKWTFPIIKGGDRALMAFGQHYSLYWATTTGATMDPFLNWKAITSQQLPGAHSEAQALFHYPAKVLGFLFFNIKNFFIQIGDALSIGWAHQPVAMIALAAAIVMLAAHLPRSAKKTSLQRSSLWDISLWIPLALPVAISIVLIYAREHYIAVLTALLVIGASVLARQHLKSTPLQNYAAAVLSLVLLACLQPAPKIEQINMQAVNGLRTQGTMGRLLELDGGWCFYMPAACTSTFMLDIPERTPYAEYIQNENITAIVVSKTLMGFATSNNKADFLAIIANPDQFGWKKTPLTKSHYLLTKLAAVPTVGGMYVANMTSFVSDKRLGDHAGTIVNQGDMTLFIHPGIKSPTGFALDVGRISEQFKCKLLKLTASISKDVTADAIARGGAVVDLTITAASSKVLHARVDSQHQAVLEISPTAGSKAHIVVDNAGNPDSDWLLIKVQPSDCH